MVTSLSFTIFDNTNTLKVGFKTGSWSQSIVWCGSRSSKMIRILLICFILWLGNKFLCSGTAGDSSSEDLESEDFYAAITGSSSRDTGHSSTRTLKAKAQSLLVSWLDADSKNDLSDATFLGEPALMNLFTKYCTIHRSRQVPLWKDYSVSVRRFWGQEVFFGPLMECFLIFFRLFSTNLYLRLPRC